MNELDAAVNPENTSTAAEVGRRRLDHPQDEAEFVPRMVLFRRERPTE